MCITKSIFLKLFLRPQKGKKQAELYNDLAYKAAVDITINVYFMRISLRELFLELRMYTFSLVE